MIWVTVISIAPVEDTVDLVENTRKKSSLIVQDVQLVIRIHVCILLNLLTKILHNGLLII